MHAAKVERKRSSFCHWPYASNINAISLKLNIELK